jgi:hypothetical protein
MALSTKVLVQRLLAKVLSKPGVDIFMRKDIKNFLYNYGKELNGGSSTACDSCCPAPSNTGATITETKLTINGPGLYKDTTSGTYGIRIAPDLILDRRLYAIKISFSGLTTQPIVLFTNGGGIVNLDVNANNWYGTPNMQNGDLVAGEPIGDTGILIYSNDSSTPNSFIGSEVYISLFTA